MAHMFLKLNFVESGRQRLLILARIFDVVLICDFIIFVISGVEMITTYISPLTLLKDFDPFLLTRLLIWIGFIGSFLHFFDVWVCWMNIYIGNRKIGIKIMLFFMFIKVILFAVLFATGVILLSQFSKINSGLKLGFFPALSNYSKFPSIKENVDLMQQYFSCCGDGDYRDWFAIQWIRDEYLPHNASKSGQNVPFSCCDPSSMRPCISHDLYSKHPNYDRDKNITIFLKGCRQMFTDNYNYFKINWVIVPWIVAMVTYILHMLAVRYAQTSMLSAIKEGHPALRGVGYLLSWGVYADEIKRSIPVELLRKMKNKTKYQLLKDESTPLKHQSKYVQPDLENKKQYKSKKKESDKKNEKTKEQPWTPVSHRNIITPTFPPSEP